MTFTQELTSWVTAPSYKEAPAASSPAIGSPAPNPPKLGLEPQKRTVVAFLRHCGCPFAEKSFLQMREAAKTHSDIAFIAVSHSDQEHTDNWLKSLPAYGTEPSNMKVVVDSDKEIYAKYGLGASSFGHVLSPSVFQTLFALGKEGISNRPTESGSRWQKSGTFAISEDGKVKYGGPAVDAKDMPDYEEFVKQLNA